MRAKSIRAGGRSVLTPAAAGAGAGAVRSSGADRAAAWPGRRGSLQKIAGAVSVSVSAVPPPRRKHAPIAQQRGALPAAREK